jgi:hypothetical protein
MSKILFFVLLSFSFVNAQPTSYLNFKVDNQEIIYQKIFFEEGITLNQLAEYYKTLPYISNVVATDDELNFDVSELVVDYKKFQFTQVATPSIIQTGKYSGKVYITAKEGKYRLTFNAIQLTGDIGYKKIVAKDNLTTYATRNNGTSLSQDWCRPNMLGLLDQSFTDKLQYVNKEKKKDDGDW